MVIKKVQFYDQENIAYRCSGIALFLFITLRFKARYIIQYPTARYENVDIKETKILSALHIR